MRLRLVGGASSTEGRVEVFWAGEWGSICDDGWDSNDAAVVCRQLGFSGSESSCTEACFGSGSGRIWLDEVGCRGDETLLTQCGRSQLPSFRRRGRAMHCLPAPTAFASRPPSPPPARPAPPSPPPPPPSPRLDPYPLIALAFVFYFLFALSDMLDMLGWLLDATLTPPQPCAHAWYCRLCPAIIRRRAGGGEVVTARCFVVDNGSVRVWYNNRELPLRPQVWSRPISPLVWLLRWFGYRRMPPLLRHWLCKGLVTFRFRRVPGAILTVACHATPSEKSAPASARRFFFTSAPPTSSLRGTFK